MVDLLGLDEVAHAPASDDAVAVYAKAALSRNSRRAFLSDCNRLVSWGGAFPWSGDLAARYLANHAGKLKVSTISRHMASLAKAHRLIGCADPTRSELVRTVMRGVRRTHGAAQKRARALLREDLMAIDARLGTSMRDLRDRALILIGFAGGFRRSELVSLDFEGIDLMPQGLLVNLARGKSDQDGKGRRVGIPFGRTKLCPVAAYEAWRGASGRNRGPVFTSLAHDERPTTDRLSAESVCLILRSRLSIAGYDSSAYSGHSLRAGLATSAAMAGVPSWKIRAQTGHASDAMLSRYIRDGELWIGNAAGAVL